MRNSIPIATIVAFSLLFGGDLANAQNSHATNTTGPATLFETLGDIKAFSKRMDSAESEMEKLDAMVDLGALYLRVVGDPRFSQSERLQGFRGRIASRLQKSRKYILRQQKKAEKNRDEEDSRYSSTSETIDSMTGLDGLESAIIDKHWRMAAHAVGGTGPSMYYSSGLHGTSGHFYRRGRAGLAEDCGDELVDLIEAILHPDFWQAGGGSGLAYYYQPLRILVVRATTTVHEDLEDLLERLR